MRHLRAWWRELCLATSENYVVNSDTSPGTINRLGSRHEVRPLASRRAQARSADPRLEAHPAFRRPARHQRWSAGWGIPVRDVRVRRARSDDPSGYGWDRG